MIVVVVCVTDLRFFETVSPCFVQSVHICPVCLAHQLRRVGGVSRHHGGFTKVSEVMCTAPVRQV